jgi:hypothetical protein
MALAITEQYEDISGLKKTAYKKAVEDHLSICGLTNNLWVSSVYTDKGDAAGWFCNFSDDDGNSYHLQNDKGSVRVFKTVDAAISFYASLGITSNVLVGWG